MRRFLFAFAAASLTGGPALAQSQPGDAAIRAGAQFQQYQNQAELQALTAAQDRAETTMTLRKLQQDRASSADPLGALSAEADLARDQMTVQDVGRRVTDAQTRAQETEAQLRQIDAWLASRRR